MVVLIDVFRILCFSLVAQLGFELELESSVVPKGDVVYGRISYRNTSDTPVTIEEPFRCDPYFMPTTVGVNVHFPKLRPKGAWPLGYGGAGPLTLQPNESGACIVLLSPWRCITGGGRKDTEAYSVAPELFRFWDDEVHFERNELTLEAWRYAGMWGSQKQERQSSSRSLRIKGCVLTNDSNHKLFGTIDDKPEARDRLQRQSPNGLLPAADVWIDDTSEGRVRLEKARLNYLEHGGSYFRTRSKKVHRMTPVWISDFDLDLGLYCATLDDLRDLAKDLKQDTNIARIVQLTLECNKWVQSESLDDRLKLEKALLESIETYRPFEREFLAKALKLIFSTKRVEYGAYGSKP
ncbi:MAG: hypothetical protein ACK5YR_15985 [Pirellula sp.]